jgi:hypothetical protein
MYGISTTTNGGPASRCYDYSKNLGHKKSSASNDYIYLEEIFTLYRKAKYQSRQTTDVCPQQTSSARATKPSGSNIYIYI